ncbi:MAG: hypothetical protein GY953_08265, partial [bacterium]|nr:hypothetical protein [bacterium]
PADGGEETLVVSERVQSELLTVTDKGIYFGKPSIRFLSFANGEIETIATYENMTFEGLALSPDGRYILYTQREARGLGLNLMLIEDFPW